MSLSALEKKRFLPQVLLRSDWAPPLLAAMLLLGMTGCALFSSAKRQGAGEAESLERALSGMIPLPFEDGMANDANHEMAALDEASRIAAADLTHFTESGDPLLRSGLVMALSVRVGDKLEVQPMRVQVMDQGEILLPMIGTVVCDGLTLTQLKSVLEDRYGAFYRSPEISLSFLYEEGGVSPWGRVLVQGRVMREGWVNIPATRDLSVSSAIQMSGGYNTSAKKSDIAVHRRQADGTTQRIPVDLERVGKRGEIERDISLRPGDVIYVPESKY